MVGGVVVNLAVSLKFFDKISCFNSERAVLLLGLLVLEVAFKCEFLSVQVGFETGQGVERVLVLWEALLAAHAAHTSFVVVSAPAVRVGSLHSSHHLRLVVHSSHHRVVHLHLVAVHGAAHLLLLEDLLKLSLLLELFLT